MAKVELPEEHKGHLSEAWYGGKRFGFVPVSDTEVYWYALTSKDKSDEIGCVKQGIREEFKDFDSLAGRIIENTPEDSITYRQIKDLAPIPQWHSGNVCLIGDAAHAMTPNLGQGACQAVEDAHFLAQYVHEGRTLAEFQDVRKKRVDGIVSTSKNLGYIAHLENPLAQLARNTMLRWTPEFVKNRQNKELWDTEWKKQKEGGGCKIM